MSVRRSDARLLRPDAVVERLATRPTKDGPDNGERRQSRDIPDIGDGWRDGGAAHEPRGRSMPCI